MVFDFAQAKSDARRVVHDTLAVAALYTDHSVDGFEPVAITARWHNKIDRFGDPQNLGMAEIIQGIDRIVLVPSDTPDITFRRGNLIKMVAADKTFRLEALEPSDGPLSRTWVVKEIKGA